MTLFARRTEQQDTEEKKGPDGSQCPYRKDEWGRIVEQPYFNPRCKKCQSCMWDNDSPLRCPITKQECFGGEVRKGDTPWKKL